jgi:3-hydroxyacyl-CoA dehydrogenase
MNDVVLYEVTRGVAVITINNPPVNASSHPVRVGMIAAIQRAGQDNNVSAIVIIGGGTTFIAGADIREFGQPPQAPLLPEVQKCIEASAKPVVAALHGTPLGGGFELALSCHYRVGLASVNVGLPEVTLGLLPGGGGTQRLTRLIGPEKALDMMLTGKKVGGDRALELGIVDRLVAGNEVSSLLQESVDFALSRVGENHVLVRDLTVNPADYSPALFDEIKAKNRQKWIGQLAQGFIVDCARAACEMPFDEGKAFETERFNELRASPQSKALRYAFFAERSAAKIPWLSKEAVANPVNSAAVIGAGTMGGGIAMCFANAGLPVFLVDVSEEALSRGMARIKSNYGVSVARGSMSQTAADSALALITSTTAFEDISNADIVIEAVFENMAVKQDIFSKLDAVMKPGAVMASNTSALNIDDIASATRRPEAVIGTHFFSPANVMKLQENVYGHKTGHDTIATVMALAKKLGKKPVLAGNCDGFIGNRISAVYSRECDFMLEEGATPWQIDNALKAFGFPMGLYLMKDMAGLDIGWSIRKNREAARDKSLRYSIVADRICELGRFGQKTGAGYYRYEGRTPSPDPEIEVLIKNISAELGIERRTFSDEEIVTRVLCAMANEGAKVVKDGIAIRASDIDVVYLFGFGFPRHRGGPMFWAEQYGLANVLDVVRQYHQTQGVFWEPAELLVERAATGSWGD